MAKITSIEEKDGVYAITTDYAYEEDGFFGQTGDNQKLYLGADNWLLTINGFRAPSELSVGDEIPDNPSEEHIREELDKIEAVYSEEE